MTAGLKRTGVAGPQLVDTSVVIFLAIVITPALAPTGQGLLCAWQAFELALTNYVHELAIAVGIAPLLYAVHGLVDLYWGKRQAEERAREAHPS